MHNRKREFSRVLLGTLVIASMLIGLRGSPAPSVAMAQDGCVRVGIGDAWTQAATADPHARATSGEMIYIINNVYERLADLDPDFNLIPKLAESWDHNADATEWTFKLRPGIKFHDGKELTADDVVYSFQRLIDPENAFPGANQLPFLTKEGITAKDVQTVVFTTAKPTPELPLLTSLFEAVIVPRGASAESMRDKANGTGPYMLEAYAPGTKQPIILRKNPNYWRADLPKSDCIELQEIQDATTRNAALQSGEIDLSAGVDLGTVGALQADPNIQIVESAPTISLVIWMWADTPPFDKLQVRQALKLVVDRDFMVQTVLLGHAVAGDDYPVPPTSPLAWSSDYPKQDIEKAKQLLAEAGYSEANPLKVTLNASEIQPGALNMAQAFKEMAAEADVQVEIVQTPLDQYWDAIWLKEPMGLSSWGVRHPAQALTIAYGCEAQFQETRWCDPDYDAIIAEAATTADDEKRIELYKQAEKMLAEEGGLINVLFFNSLNGLRANCSGYTPPVPFYQVDFTTIECATES